MRIFIFRVVNVRGEMFRRCARPRGKHQPRSACLLPAFVAQVVTPKAILLRDAISSLNRSFLGSRSARRDSPQNVAFVAKFNAHHAPGNLRLFGLRQNFEAWRKSW